MVENFNVQKLQCFYQYLIIKKLRVSKIIPNTLEYPKTPWKNLNGLYGNQEKKKEEK